MTTTEIGAGDPKGAKRAKSEIQTKENKTHKTNTKITIEDISNEPISDPTAQYNLIQQIIQADISDPLLLGDYLLTYISRRFLWFKFVSTCTPLQKFRNMYSLQHRRVVPSYIRKCVKGITL